MFALGTPIRVLLVADEPTTEDLRQELHRCGYEVVTAPDAAAALPLLVRLKLDSMVLKPGPADGDAAALVTAIIRAEPELLLVLLAEQEDASRAVRCLQAGAADYLIGRYDAAAIVLALQEARARRERRLAEAAAANAVREEMAHMTASLRRERERVSQMALATLESLVCVVEARDAWLAGHSVRVAELAACLAAEQGRSDADVEMVRLAGRVHDIGMISLRDGILSKTGPLTLEEFDQVKRHVVVGAQILSPLPQFGLISSFVRSHHERWDGQGYPDGLSGDGIPWGAALIGAAEIYDAMTTERPYRTTMTPEEAVQEMGKHVDSILPPDVYQTLRAVVERRRALVFLHDPAASTTLSGGELFEPQDSVLPPSGNSFPGSGKLFLRT